MREIWKDIKGFEGHYQVSNKGRIKSLDKSFLVERNGRVYTRTLKGKIRKFYFDFDKHASVTLSMNGIITHCLIGRLVYETFIGEIKDNLVICYKDNNSRNLCINNLCLKKKQSGK